MKGINFLLILLLLGVVQVAFSQKSMTGYQQNNIALERLYERTSKQNAERELRVRDYLNNHPKAKRLKRTDNNIYFLHDVENGFPIYLTTFNAETAEHLGVNAVRTGGRLGLNLTGSNMKVHVWDGGAPRVSHQEYGGRVSSGEQFRQDTSNHSTHVTGTILASGINRSARGFAYEAEGETYNFDDDTEEILEELATEGISVSNHSYGTVSGWSRGEWFGDSTISRQEDFRFGFYTAYSRIYDNITYNAPYYTVVKAAGNDRGDSGDGAFPPDGPYDIISDFGVSKNVITIGAIRQLNGPYTGPDDINISSFTSFGPVDDGRIKPDFVAPGVSIFSCFSNSDDSYGRLSGTSMAAPAATGAFTIINEAALLLKNTLLRSATLKAIVMNTAFEAGPSDGPDYQHGWGMINVEGAVETILNEDGVNIQILEETLENNDTFLLELNPLPDEKITLSLAWTDLPGMPPSRQLDPTDLMLVNDLDMRIIDEVGNEVFPWILDPSRPTVRAVRGDNFRDNAEKIEFDNPQPRRYFVKITHKGNLATGSQNFSLVVDYTSENTGTENLYWVNNDGTWQDISQWAKNSGGSADTLTPTVNNRLIFDDNSFTTSGGVIIMDQDYEVAAVTALSQKEILFDLGGNTLTIRGSAIFSSPDFIIQNGTIVFENENEAASFLIDFDQSQTRNLDIVVGINNRASWKISDNQVQAQSFVVNGGQVTIENSLLDVESLDFGGDGGNNAVINFRNSLLSNPLNVLIKTNNWMSDNQTVVRFDEADINATITVTQDGVTTGLNLDVLAGNVLTTGSSFSVASIAVDSAALTISNPLTTGNFLIASSGALNMDAGVEMEVVGDFTVASDIDNFVEIRGLFAEENATINMSNRQKLCFDFMNISNADLSGVAAVSVGTNSRLEDALGWSTADCEDLLFADFEGDVFCAGGLTTFTNTSDGNIAEQVWFVDDFEISQASNAIFSFPEPGFYNIRLELRDEQGAASIAEETVEVTASRLPEVSVGSNPRQLFSFEAAEFYQWYRNGEKLEGETARAIRHNDVAGTYFVVISNGGCNKKSEEFNLGLTSVEDLDNNGGAAIRFFPNPARDLLNINFQGEVASEVEIQMINTLGKIVYQRILPGSDLVSLNLSGLNSGMYICLIKMGDKLLTKKIIKQDDK